MKLKDQLVLIRAKLNLSQEALARELKVSFATINRWEQGRVVPQRRYLIALAEFCKKKNVQFQGETKMKRKVSSRGPKLVSLFSGCGGLDVGFEQAGFHRIWANDFDSDAQATFRLNLGDIDGRDIRNVPAKDIPDADIIIAGFPCQPFSNAGNRKGIKDSRGMLYSECLRIIKDKKPKVFLFENVKGLMSSKYIDGRNLVDVIAGDVEEMGYAVTYKVVNAVDYGVPQRRERLIMIGVRNDLNVYFSFPKSIPISEKQKLKYVLDIPEFVPNQVSWPLSPQAMSMLPYIPEGGSWKDIPYDKLPPRLKRIRDNMKKYHAPKFYRRFGMDEINGTITASAQPENCGIIHPILNRRFTIREVARIQSFPDDYVFYDSTLKEITASYKVIGNAVPCKLAKAIAAAIMEQVFKK